MSSNDYSTDNVENDYDLSLLEILITYLRNWRWYLLSIFICLGLAFGYLKLSTPLYKIRTDLLIKDDKENMGGQNDLLKSLDLFSSAKIIDNEVQILKSNTIIEKVIKDLNIQTQYFDTEGVKAKELYNNIPFEVDLISPSSIAFSTTLKFQFNDNNQVSVNGRSFKLDTILNTEAGLVLLKKKNTESKQYYKKEIHVRFKDIDDLLLRYSLDLKIDPISKQGTVLIITLQDAIPKRGEDFLNTLINEYNHAAIEDKNKVTSTTLFFITDRIKKLSEELGSVEKNVEQYKSSNRITDISSQSQLFLESVKDNDVELNKVQIQLNVLQNLEKSLNSSQEPIRIPSMMGIEDPTVLGQVSKLAEAELKKESLLQTTTESNPLVRSYTDQINLLKQSISSSVQNLKRGLQITQEHLQSQNSRFESTIQRVPSKERGLLDVMRQQEIKNGLFTYLLQKREETAMSLASAVSDSRTIDYAKSSKYPVKPINWVIYLIFLLAALAIPTTIIYIRRLLNYKILRRADITKVTDAPILAEISHSQDPGNLPVTDNPRSMVAEQIRVLRTNLQFIIPDESQKVILFTSTISGEGKSFISLNLGASLATTGKKVIILELDLRKPKLHGSLNIENSFGLSNYLIGKADTKDIIKKIEIQENYFIIPSGPIPPNPAELIANGKISELIELLKKDFDYIILDAPPIGVVTDAQILSSCANTTLFIVRHNYTIKNHIHAIDEYYRTEKFKNLKIILNSVDLQIGYGSSYGYGYGYGYYSEEKSSGGFNIFKLFKFNRR
ncbi:MAG: wzc 1 [Mucilaginibacter sp.]|nr:wzc 1 [Mucilaginibacter sp.]